MLPGRRVLECFIALAVLRGTVSTFLSGPYYGAFGSQILTASATLALTGAFLLFAWCLLRGHRLPGLREWPPLVLLALPAWFNIALVPPYVRSIPWLHETAWGIPFLLELAAPLWLALLAALHLVRVEVPRAVVGAGIAGIAATLLMVPTEALDVQPNQAVVLIIHLLLMLLTTYSWDFARHRLDGIHFTSAAAGVLLLLGAAGVGFALLLERAPVRPVDWHDLILVGPLQLCVYVAGWCLWFYLLRQLPLPAFSMNPIAQWTASTAGGFFLFGLLSWRVDLALSIAIAAVVVALRARVSDEQTLALGLHNS